MQETVKVNIIVDDDDWTKCGRGCRYLSYEGDITGFRCKLFFDNVSYNEEEYLPAKLKWDAPNFTSKKTRCEQCLNCMRGD